jgi:MFS family permease
MMMEPWFDPMKFGIFYGGIGGGVLGSLGGVLGAIAGKCAPQEKARGFVMGAFTAFMLFGIVNLVLGIVAVATGQPYGIWYPLVLIGFLLTLLFGMLKPVVRKRYEEAETRRMEAAAFRRA